MRQNRLYDQGGRELLSLETSVLNRADARFLHNHAMLEISLVKSGGGVCAIGSRRYDAQAGDIFVIGDGERHCITATGPAPLTHLALHIDREFLCGLFGRDREGKVLQGVFAGGQGESDRLGREHPCTRAIAQVLLDIERELTERRPYYDLQVRACIQNLVLGILRGYERFSGRCAPSPIPPDDTCRTREVLHYIDRNLRDNLTLGELAGVACLSPSYFSVLFKRENGIALFAYITQRRVEYAISLISTTAYSLTQIADICGFNNSTSFNKAFRRVTGKAPSHFRRRTGGALQTRAWSGTPFEAAGQRLAAGAENDREMH